MGWGRNFFGEGAAERSDGDFTLPTFVQYSWNLPTIPEQAFRDLE
jgi:hypothetical protein